MSYRLEVRGGGGGNRQIDFQDQVLKAGQTRIYHLPILCSEYSNYMVETIDSLGRRSNAHMAGDAFHFLNVCSMRDWASEVELQDFAKHYETLGGVSGRYGRGSTKYVSQIELTHLPDNWNCYSPFNAVFFQEQLYQRISPVQSKALMDWVRAGGRLVVYNAETEKSENWTLGRVDYVKGNPVKSRNLRTEWRVGVSRWQRFSPGNHGAAIEEFPFAILRKTGRVGGLLLATFFFILAGPVNHFYFSRRKKIRLLLISLPLASIGCCLLITGYFLASQGFAKRGGSIGVIVLDEEKDSAITFSRHSLFSGLYPLGGFVFDRDVAFLHMPSESRDEDFRMDMTEKQRLRSGLFTPSVNFHYFTAKPWTTRAKLVWDLEEMTLINGFDAPATRILLRVDGKYYAAPRTAKGGKAALEEIKLAPGANTTLQELALNKDTDAERYLLRHMGDFLSAFPTDVPAYIVVFHTPPVDLNAGLEIKGDNAYCVLVGKSILRAKTGE
jgi:hypothetical protein